jgi:hypothetical protein
VRRSTGAFTSHYIIVSQNGECFNPELGTLGCSSRRTGCGNGSLSPAGQRLTCRAGRAWCEPAPEPLSERWRPLAHRRRWVRARHARAEGRARRLLGGLPHTPKRFKEVMQYRTVLTGLPVGRPADPGRIVYFGVIGPHPR